MKLIFLGTGTSQGVPMIGGGQEGLNRENPKNWRTRSSVHIQMGELHIQVDASPEFRLQCLQNNIKWIDIFILTHGHADHIVGMDDLRRFCDVMPNAKLPVYASEEGCERIGAIFPYALLDKPTHSGYPCFDMKLMPKTLELKNGGKIHSCYLPHGKFETLGLVFEFEGKRIAYFNDAKALTNEAAALASGAEIVVLDGLRPHLHPTHMSIPEAIAAAKTLNAKKVFFTHMTWQVDYDEWSKKIPENAELAYDGLRVEL